MSVAENPSGQDRKSQALAEATAAAKDGRFLDAHAVLASLGDPKTAFRDYHGAQRTDVSWIVQELGAPRLGRWHTLKAYREAPESLAVRNQYISLVSEENGPLEAMEFVLQSPPVDPEDDPEERLRWLWHQAANFSNLRDFAPAQKLIEQMESIDDRPDMKHFSWAYWFEKQDRYDEAIEALQKAVEARESRSTIGYLAHLYTLTGRDEQAYEILSDLDARKQVPSLSWQLTSMAYERRDYDQCQKLLERFESMTPLRERGMGEGFTMFRSELARRAGDDEAAIAYAKRAKSKYGDKIAARLADPDRKNRVDKVLPVDFVRQHEMTCGPATLSAVSGYWGRPAEHLEVAEEICYNGTTAYAERNWCDTNGYVTRAMSVTEDVTESLIDRDIPFTLVTRGAGYAHLQAVIGYDGRTGTILIRDPYHRVRGAASAEEFIESQESHGPRGLVLIPEDQAGKLDGIDFPDEALHDAMYKMDGALKVHDRKQAIEIVDDLKSRFPEHRLTWQAVRQMAMYDQDEREMAVAIEKLLEMYPEDTAMRMSYVSTLANLKRDAERIELLRKWTSEANPHPLLNLQLAEILARDGRTRDEAHGLLRLALRRAHSYAPVYIELGDLLWVRGSRAEACQMYRFAACLEEKDEFNAQRYFDASVALGQTEDAVEWLRNRFEKFGHQSARPALTLHSALAKLRRYDEGVEVLETALKNRPDDTELAIDVAVALAETSGQYIPRAESILESVKDKSSSRAWCQAASSIATMQCKFSKAKSLLESELDRTPLAMGLREAISNLIFEIDGEDASIEFWRQAAQEHSHYHPIVERYAISLRSRPIEEVIPVLEKILQDNPDDAWAVRELAQHHLTAGNLDEATRLTDRAEQLDVEVTFVLFLRANLAERYGDHARARDILRSILEKDVDDDYCVNRLIAACENAEQSREELAWVMQELKKQPITGSVLTTWRSNAEALLPVDEVLSTLQEAVDARGDLWSAHQALIHQLKHMNRLDEAVARADAACQQFPLEPNAWYERYHLAVVSGDLPTQHRTLDRCRLLRPTNATILRSFSEVLSSEGRYQEAAEALEKLVSQQPLDPVSRGFLGDVYSELNEKEKALEQFESAVKLDPDYEYAWNCGEHIASRLEDRDWRRRMAAAMIEAKPHSVSAWIEQATSLAMAEEFDDAFAALDKAEAIDPFAEAVHTIRARMLMNAGDYNAAMEALQPPVYKTIPASLQYTRAQLLWDIGQHDMAYEILLAASEEHPESTAVWRRLEIWAADRNDRERLMLALEKQRELNPHDPDTLDSVGSRYADLGETEKAMESLARAVEIAPTYTGSRCQWFDLLLADNRWDEAAAIMQDLPRMDSHPIVLARRMKVAMRREGNQTRDIESAKKDFEALLASEDYSNWASDTAIELFDKAEMSDFVDGRIEAGLIDDDANEDFGRLWCTRRLYQRSRKAFDGSTYETVPSVRPALNAIAEKAKALCEGPRPKMGYRMVGTTMGFLSQAGNESYFRRFIRQNDWLQKHTHTYVATLFAMAENPKAVSHGKMKQWVATWHQRSDYEPWMLTNVHECLRIVGKETDAREVVLQAIEMPADHMHSQLRLWATHDAIAEQNWEMGLRHFMNASRVENLDGLDRLLHYWAEMMLMMAQSEDRKSSFDQVKSAMNEIPLPPKFFSMQPAYRTLYEQMIRTIAKTAGSPGAKFWAMKKLIRPKMSKIGWEA